MFRSKDYNIQRYKAISSYYSIIIYYKLQINYKYFSFKHDKNGESVSVPKY